MSNNNDDFDSIVYKEAKQVATKMVQEECRDFSILVIPRVYSECRDNGLIGKLKKNSFTEMTWEKFIYFYSLEDFLNELSDKLLKVENSEKYIYFPNKECKTIKNIKELYAKT